MPTFSRRGGRVFAGGAMMPLFICAEADETPSHANINASAKNHPARDFGKGTASAVPPRMHMRSGFSPWGDFLLDFLLVKFTFKSFSANRQRPQPSAAKADFPTQP